MNTIPNYSTASKTARKVDPAELAHLIVQNDQCGGTGNLTVLPGAGRPAWTACSAVSCHYFEFNYALGDSSTSFAVETVNRNGYQTEKTAHEYDAPIFVLENLGMHVELNKFDHASGSYRLRDAFIDNGIKVKDSLYSENLVRADLRGSTYDY